MGADDSLYGQLPSQRDGLVQQHVVLDAQGRVSEVYTASLGALDQEACTKVSYIYQDATSTVVAAMKEENAVWLTAFQPTEDPTFFVARS